MNININAKAAHQSEPRAGEIGLLEALLDSGANFVSRYDLRHVYELSPDTIKRQLEKLENNGCLDESLEPCKSNSKPRVRLNKKGVEFALDRISQFESTKMGKRAGRQEDTSQNAKPGRILEIALSAIGRLSQEELQSVGEVLMLRKMEFQTEKKDQLFKFYYNYLVNDTLKTSKIEWSFDAVVASAINSGCELSPFAFQKKSLSPTG